MRYKYLGFFDRMKERSDIYFAPSLQYPIDIEWDGNIIAINSEEELRGVYERCDYVDATDFDCAELRANIEMFVIMKIEQKEW